MPTNQVYNRTQARTIDRAVRTITVAVGYVIVTKPGGGAFSLGVGQSHTFPRKPVAGLTIYSPDSARVKFTYGDDPVKASELEAVKPQAAKKKRVGKKKRAGSRKLGCYLRGRVDR